MSDSWIMGALAAQDAYNPEEGAVQADLLRAQQPAPARLDPGLRRAPGDTAMRPAAETFGQVVGDLVIPQDPLDYAAMAALGPAGKMVGKGVRAGALAMGGVLGLSNEAEASKLKAIKQGIKAYHSSPHDFEKFDASKIGTGEGAQVYGHGLYFAENPAVSGQGGQYWKQFHGRFPNDEHAAAGAMLDAGFNREKAIEIMRKRLAENPLVAEQYGNALRLLESNQPIGPRTYEVNIRADPAQMLDWDKPLAAQPRSVQDIAAEAIKNPGRGAGFLADPSDFAPISGGNLYHALKAQKGDMVRAADVFREASIPGIKYLDQGSRAGGIPTAVEPVEGGWRVSLKDPQGITVRHKFDSEAAARAFAAKHETPTNNYVVFDPSIVDIMKKYGIAGAAAPMGALAATDEYR